MRKFFAILTLACIAVLVSCNNKAASQADMEKVKQDIKALQEYAKANYEFCDSLRSIVHTLLVMTKENHPAQLPGRIVFRSDIIRISPYQDTFPIPKPPPPPGPQ